MYLLNVFLKLFLISASHLFLMASANADAGQFNKKAFYSITTEVGGKKQAITFEIPEGNGIKSLTNNASKSKVALAPHKANENRQLWQLNDRSDSYLIYSKISDQTEALTGILVIYNVNGEFSAVEDEKYYEKYNRLTVSSYRNETQDYWQIIKQSNGKYRITNALGMKKHLRKADDAAEYGWREERSLEAVKTKDGKIVLRNNPNSNAPGQLWTITKVGN